MRKTTKQIGWNGQYYAAAITPTTGDNAVLTVDGQVMGRVLKIVDKCWDYTPADGSTGYRDETLVGIMRSEVINYAEAIRFREEVALYNGPMDVSDATAPCVDCGEQVNIHTVTETWLGGVCPARDPERPQNGHRVRTEAVSEWKHQQRVIAAVIASRKEA